MKILKYGEGYPKTCTCDKCGSELEYEQSDTYWCTVHHFEDDNNIYHEEKHKLIICPVCDQTITLETVCLQSCVAVAPEVLPKPKKRWWQR
jgi:hypothetical protein